MAIISRLRRWFSAQPSTSSSAVYRRLKTAAPPHILPINCSKACETGPTPDELKVTNDMSYTEAGQLQTAPSSLPIYGGDDDESFNDLKSYTRYDGGRPPSPKTAPPGSLPINDGDDDRSFNDLKSYTRYDGGRPPSPKTAQPSSLPINDGSFNDLKSYTRYDGGRPPSPTTAPPSSLPVNDGDDDGSLNGLKARATFRIKNELRVMNENSPTHCSFGPVGHDIFEMEGIIIGPPGTCYEGGIFQLSIKVPPDYPCKPPKIKFKTKVFHPNVEENGTINVDILEENWSPALTIEKLLLSICLILSEPDAEVSINEASILYKSDWLSYYMTARDWTTKYAIGS